MWRRYGDAAYATLVLAGLVLQAAALGLITWAFIPGASALFPAVGPWRSLLGALLVSVAVLLGVVGFVLGYHVLSARRQAALGERVRAWNERWVRVLFGEEPPRGRLPTAALEALLQVRDMLRGSHALRAELLLQRYWDTALLLRPLRSRRLVRRLDALDRLARARLTPTFFPILRATEEADPRTRAMALRAAARILAHFPSGPALESAAGAFARSLDDPRIPTGVALDCLILLDEAASEVIPHLLAPATPRGLRRAAVETAGRLERRDLAEPIAALLRDPDAEIRAAALRAVRGMRVLGEGAAEAVVAALEDPTDFVRVQAVRASVLLPAPAVIHKLWPRMGDRSWWVRRATGETLLRLGSQGRAALDRATHDHPDRYARHMAIQVLFDDRRIDAVTAERLREAV